VRSSHTPRALPALLLGGALCLAATAHGQPAARSPYTEVFYPSAGLRIHAYLYRPDGPGPFPVVIYNHGSRVGREWQPMPFEHIGGLFTRARYVVLVPERRGYGRSDGPTWAADVGGDKGRAVGRLEAETDDVLAALPFLRTLPFADASRVGIMGWSFGGIVTMFAVSRSGAFAVAIDQAGGALTWNGNAGIRGALAAAAERTTTPTLLQVAENDRTTDSITTLGAIFQKRGVSHRMVIYGPFGPPQTLGPGAPGHQIFSARGMHVWQADVLEFLGRHLGPGMPKP